MVGSKGITVVREDFLGKPISINGSTQRDAGIGAVFWQSERCGSDIESAGIHDDRQARTIGGLQDGIAHSHAELLTKVRAKCGGSDDIIDAVSCAKALEGKGQIERNGKKLSVI